MGVFQNNLLAGAAAAATAGGGDFYSYQIEQSVRFTTAESSRLYKTFGASSDSTKFTLSLWIKRALVHVQYSSVAWQQIISKGTGVNGGGSAFGFEVGGGTSGTGSMDNDDRISWYGLRGDAGGSNGGDDRIDGMFYDNHGWYHIVVRADTSQSAADKVRYYINGNSQTRVTTNEPSGNFNRFNTNGDVHSIGEGTDGNNGLDAYLAEFIFADGQSYAPTQFGESKNGVWIPKDPTGTTFGNNGFHLKFENANDLGNDSSGNNNDWSVTGLGTDHQVLDSPTFGS